MFARLLLAATIGAAMPQVAIATSFDETLVATYQNNPSIKAARQQLQATDEGVAQALSGVRPTVTAGYDYGRQRTALAGASWTHSNAETKGLRVSQPISGVGTWASYEGASQRVKAGQYQLSATEQQVLLQAVTSYMDVASASQILGLSRTNAEVLEKQLIAATARFQVGEVTRTDVAQAESRLSNAKSQVITTEGELLSAIATFERVTGFRPDGALALPDKLPELPANLDDALVLSHDKNPQFMAAIHNAKASRFDVRTNEAVLLPSVAVVGTLARQTGAGANGNSDFDQDKIALEVNVPLYQSGAEYSRVREAKAIARQRDQESTATRMAIDEAVTQGWEQLETAGATIATRQDQIKAAQIALDGVKQEQQYGSRTVLDVLDAEQELFTARTNLVRAQRNRIVAAYSLANTLGQMTPAALALNVENYDPTLHAAEVKWKPIGF